MLTVGIEAIFGLVVRRLASVGMGGLWSGIWVHAGVAYKVDLIDLHQWSLDLDHNLQASKFECQRASKQASVQPAATCQPSSLL